MIESGYYPPGAEFDPNAPYNEPVIPEKEFEITCCQTLSKTTNVYTDNYIPGCCGCDYEDGVAVGWHDEDDTSDTNWAEEYHDNDHYTPIQLIGLFKESLKSQLESWEGMEETSAGKAQIRRIEYLIEECEGWIEDETEYIEES